MGVEGEQLSAMAQIKFVVALVPLLALLAGCAGLDGVSAPSFLSETPTGAVWIPAKIRKPEGPGPFPAIVMVHDCSGLGPRSSGAPSRWARLLVAQGYVVLIPDSFTPRGFPEGVCTNSRAQAAGPAVRASDALGAAAYLRSLPEVDGARIGLMGGSHGGSTTLAALVRPRAGFAAAVALYPGCGAPYGAWSVRRQAGSRGPITGYAGVYAPGAPLLILIGEQDDWTPAEPCQRLADAARQQGYPVEIKVYPDAHHSFDNSSPVRYVKERNNANAPDGRGATTGGNPAAWEDAEKQVTAFFATHLKASW